MSLCAYCGTHTQSADGLCTCHMVAHGEDWAMANRIMCDLLHRGIVWPGPPASVRIAGKDLEVCSA